MAVPLSKYLDIKDKCCFAYFDNDENTKNLLEELVVLFTKSFPEIAITLCFTKSNLNLNKFAFYQEFKNEEEIKKFLEQHI